MTQKNNRIPSFTLRFESILPNFDKPSVKKKFTTVRTVHCVRIPTLSSNQFFTREPIACCCL